MVRIGYRGEFIGSCNICHFGSGNGRLAGCGGGNVARQEALRLCGL